MRELAAYRGMVFVRARDARTLSLALEKQGQGRPLFSTKLAQPFCSTCASLTDFSLCSIQVYVARETP